MSGLIIECENSKQLSFAIDKNKLSSSLTGQELADLRSAAIKRLALCLEYKGNCPPNCTVRGVALAGLNQIQEAIDEAKSQSCIQPRLHP